MLYARPDLLHRMLAVNAEAVAAYLNAQIAAGAQAVMVFDSWGGVLADGAFQAFSLAYTQRVLDQLDRSVPAIVFTKGGGPWLEAIAASGADVVGVDWTVNLAQARERVGGRVALQGNLDPMVLFGGEAAVRAEARRVLDAFGPPQRPGGGHDGHIFNLGHGIHQLTPPDSVAALVDEVHRYSHTLRIAGAPSK
jgi:uroporphyrinogen decarboxylase